MTAPRVAYICSSGRSGSTLLNLMLGSHPDFVCLGEIEHLPKNVALDTVCTCGARVSACPFWNRVFDRLASDSGMDMRAEPYRHALGYLKASSVVDPRYQTKAYLVRRRFVLGLKYLQYRYGLDLLPPWIRNE
ncbi:MAG: sulfotransferase, partial [Burkholderiaceae bacterium]|nr:sulfotransferase [Burkholderiaceae bacterium]